MVTLPDAIAAVPARVRSEMDRRGLSYRDLAGESGISLNTAWRVAQGSVDPRLSTVVALARWLER